MKLYRRIEAQCIELHHFFFSSGVQPQVQICTTFTVHTITESVQDTMYGALHGMHALTRQ